MKKYLIFCFCITSFVFADGQEISPREYVQSLYDKDIALYKGTIHDANPQPKTGHKYLYSYDFTSGSITSGGVVFDSLDLKLDVYKQNLVLKYNCSPIDLRYPISIDQKSEDAAAAQTYTIDVDPLFVEAFTLGIHQFVATRDANVSFPYLQVIPSTRVGCYIGWRKDYLIDGTRMQFSEANRYVYLKKDGKYKRIFRRSSIIKVLPKYRRAEVKKYCKVIKFNVKRSGVNKYYLLFSHIDKVMNSYEK